MQYSKRIIALTVFVVLIYALTAPCFATPVTITGIDFFTAAFQTFIEICGLTTILSSNGVDSSSSDPYSQSQLTDQYQDLYDEYQNTLQTTESMSSWYNTYKDSIYLNIDTTNSVISPTIDATLSDWFSGFTGWILEDIYHCTRTESGFSHTAGTFDSPLISTGSINPLPVTNTYPTLENGLNCGTNTAYSRVVLASSSVTPVYAYCTVSGNNYTLHAVTTVPGVTVYTTNYDSSGRHTDQNALSTYSVVNSSYYVYNTRIGIIGSTANIPSFNSDSDAIQYFYNSVNVIDSISLRPKDKYNEDAIPVPNVESSTYVPEAVEGEYSDAITGAIEGIVNPTIDDVFQAVLDAVTTNTEVIAEEGIEPIPVSPVMPPFMPFDIPSFNFNFSGIWHYVTEWVSSLGSGLGFFAYIWSNIPYAMVVPIYAAAVIVIVTSIFKRFV